MNSVAPEPLATRGAACWQYEARGAVPGYERRLSLLKFIRYLSVGPANFLRALRSLSISDAQARAFHEALVRYCCYDKRKRQNYSELWENLA